MSRSKKKPTAVSQLAETLPTQEDPESPTETPASVVEQTPCPDDSLISWPIDADSLPLEMEMGDLGDINLDLSFDDLWTPDALLNDSLSLSSLTPKPEQMLVPSRDPSQDASQEGSLEMIASRLQYALDEIKKVPASIVLENQTPWSHPYLFRAQMPRDMQDAQARRALYIAKTPTNAPFVRRTIQARAHEMLSTPMPKDRLDVIARLQATLLYQIISLLDGDISMRASAQQALPALEHAMQTLLPLVRWERAQQESDPMDCPTKETWNEWIFQESARRTLFFTSFFIIAYKVLVGRSTGRCEDRYDFCQSWTLSAHLWKASTVVDFAVAWRERRHFVVTKEGFGDVLRDAAADDVETFGRMLIVASFGIEETRLWFYNRGGSL
ncbi:Transcription factor gsfR2 [Colletotrichum shisoi]|uniref:Transcription factor gsfR2 n=1 Tax=Colletotrichum shisoi TaxID=2078593 RepID=A0A5Q4BZ80_9PEZI|nr:Transcription factor gsfR2 [Colletotrichum shisoi]